MINDWSNAMQNNIQRIQTTIDYIEQNLENDITLEQLASMAYSSKFYYPRLFHAMVGESAMEYVRKRRVTYAANIILNTKMKLVDIAYKCGFQSQVNFSRTFKQIYGITPMECRKKVKAVEIYEKINLLGRSFSKEKSSLLHGPVIVEKKGFTVVGKLIKVSYEDNFNSTVVFEFWMEFLKCINEIKGVINPLTVYGISFESKYHKYCNYMVCIEVENLKNIPKGMIGRIIPDYKYAVFNFMGMDDISNYKREYFKAVDFIYGHWYPLSEYKLDTNNDLIEIITSDDEHLSNISMDIYLPIKGDTL